MQQSMLDLMGDLPSSGKTSPGSSQTKETPLDVSWEVLSEQMMPCERQTGRAGPALAWLPGQGHGQLGGFSMLNISEWPNDAGVCSLSSILEIGSIPPRFYLSEKACAGILRRAEKRGKELPPALRQALVGVAEKTCQRGD